MAIRKETKEQVLAKVCDVYHTAKKLGEDGFKACEIAFPGIPFSVVLEASVAVNMADDEAWWEQVERTIDGEIIKDAMIACGKAGAS